MKLSLCLAVYNEEKNIHYPLDSAYDLADEVIIVDGGSTDRTVEIAKSYGKKIKIINAKNLVMFHKNKQKAIEAAQGEWILQLDADEALSPELKQEILLLINPKSDLSLEVRRTKWEIRNPKQFKNSNFENSNLFRDSKFDIRALPVAFWLPRKNWFLIRFLMKGGQYPDYTIRLYRNGYARFPCKDVHENVEIINPKSDLSLEVRRTKREIRNPKQFKNSNFENSNLFRDSKFDIRASVGYLNNPLLHYADPDFSRYLMRWDRYTTSEVQNSKFKIQNENKNPIIMFLEFFIWKPLATFFMMYFRHKGFMDGFPGFVFSLFSSIRFWVIYVKWRAKKFSF